MILHTTYKCEICGVVYESKKACEACESQKMTTPLIKPGDIVFCGRGRFGWFDGDKGWVKKERTGDKLFSFYYIVTAIEIEESEHAFFYIKKIDGESINEHRWQVHLFTKAMSEKTGYQSGYTFDEGHMTVIGIKKLPKLPGIRKFRKEFVGQTAECLV